MIARHDFDWHSGGFCRYCGVSIEAVQDGLAPNCSVIRQLQTPWTAIPVALGAFIVGAIFGNILFGWGA